MLKHHPKLKRLFADAIEANLDMDAAARLLSNVKYRKRPVKIRSVIIWG